MALEESLRIDSEADLADLDKTIDKIGDVGSAMRDIEGAGDDAERGTAKASGGLSAMVGWLGKAAGALGALGLAAGIGGAVMAGVNASLAWSEALNTLQAQTGATAAQVEAYRDIGQRVYKSGWGDGVEDVVASMSTVAQITGASGTQLEGLTENALALRQAFGTDVRESVDAVDKAMVQFGINGNQAFDLIAYTLQRTGDPAGDLLETVSEFGTNFEDLGYSADQMFQVLNQGSAAGIFQFAKIGDAVKEFGIRTKEGGADVQAAFNDIFQAGEKWTFASNFDEDVQITIDSSKELFAAIRDGSVDIADVADEVSEYLLSIEDPLERNRLGVALLGSYYEDLGDDILTAMDITETGVDGAEGSMNRMKDAMQNGLRPALERLKRSGLTFLANFLEPLVTKVIDKAVPAIEQLAGFLENDAAPAIAKFADAIGDKAGPAIEDITEFAGEAADTIGDFAATVSDFVARNPMVITYLKYFAIALAAIVTAAVVIPAIIGAITAVMGGLGVALGVIFSPVVLIAAALAALGLAYKENLFGFRDAVNEVAGVVGEAFGRIKDFIGGLIDAFKTGGLSGAGQFIQDKLLNPITEAVRNVNWGEVVATLWGNFKNMLGVGLALIWQASVWVNENITQPMFNDLRNVNWGEVVSTLWNTFKTVMTAYIRLYFNAATWVYEHILQPIWNALSNVNWGEVVSTLWANFKTLMTAAIALHWQAAVWVNEHIVQPIGAYLANVNWGEVLGTLWGNFKNMLGVALALHWQAAVWVKEKLIDPLVNAVTNVDWAGALTSVGDFGGSLFTKLKETLPDVGAWINEHIITPIAEALSGLGAMVKGAINAAIPDSIGVDVPGVDLGPLGSLDGQHIGVDIPDPFPGYATGTPWTGSGRPSEMAGVVHQREAVVPEGGMRVYPSRNGLMLEGGTAPEVVIPITLELDGRVLFETVKRLEGLRAT